MMGFCANCISKQAKNMCATLENLLEGVTKPHADEHVRNNVTTSGGLWKPPVSPDRQWRQVPLTKKKDTPALLPDWRPEKTQAFDNIWCPTDLFLTVFAVFQRAFQGTVTDLSRENMKKRSFFHLFLFFSTLRTYCIGVINSASGCATRPARQTAG